MVVLDKSVFRLRDCIQKEAWWTRPDHWAGVALTVRTPAGVVGTRGSGGMGWWCGPGGCTVVWVRVTSLHCVPTVLPLYCHCISRILTIFPDFDHFLRKFPDFDHFLRKFPDFQWFSVIFGDFPGFSCPSGHYWQNWPKPLSNPRGFCRNWHFLTKKTWKSVISECQVCRWHFSDFRHFRDFQWFLVNFALFPKNPRENLGP